jgi:NAD(P)H-nitrite reductase large subunit
VTDPTPIRRCVCFQTTFAELKLRGYQSVTEIATDVGCTTGCGLCRPYIEAMLRTGETAFAVFTPSDGPSDTAA